MVSHLPDQPFEFKLVTLRGRPARGVVLIRNDDPDWQDIVLRTVEWLSKCWGGAYWLIVPTDGNKIDETFWWILEKYDPDYIYLYRRTLADRKLSRPDEYAIFLEEQVKLLSERNADTNPDASRKQFDAQAGQIADGPDAISESLDAELKRRLNPFYKGNIIEGYVSLQSEPNDPITHLNTAMKSIGPISSFAGCIAPQIEGTKQIQLLFYSLLGKTTSSLIEEMKKEGLLGLFLGAKSFPEDQLEDLALSVWRQTRFLEDMPFGLTTRGMNFYINSESGWKQKPVIIAGSTLNDFCLFYNLSRLRSKVFWLPTEHINSFKNAISEAARTGGAIKGEAAYVKWVVRELESSLPDLEEQQVLLYSDSLRREELEEIKRISADAATFIVEEEERISNKFVIQPSIEKLLPYIRRLFIEEGSGRNYIEQFYRGESVSFLNTPIPPYPNMPPHDHKWVTDVKVQNYLLPPLAGIGSKSLLYPRTTEYKNWLVRSGREGLAYFCPDIAYFHVWGEIGNVVVKPDLKLLDDLTIAEEILGRAGYFITYSDKGNYHRESALKFAGFDQLCRFLLDENQLALLTRYLNESDSKENDKKETLETFLGNGRRYLSFKGIETIIGKDKTPGILDKLIESEILHRGFVFQCRRCRNAAWYSIEEVSSTFTCSRCRTTAIYKREHWKKPEEPEWYYQLDEIIYQGMKHNMHVPIFALMDQKRRAREAFHYVPEIELRRTATAQKPEMELDFLAVRDSDVILGEATVSDKLKENASEEKAELSSLLTLAKSVHAKELILATFSDEWNEGTKQRITDIFRGNQVSIRLLVKRDLKQPLL